MAISAPSWLSRVVRTSRIATVRANREPVTPNGAAAPLQFWACHLTALTVEIARMPSATGPMASGGLSSATPNEKMCSIRH